MTEPVTVRRACDGPSCRSVSTVRELSQTPNSQKSKCFATGLTTVRRDCDGPSCRSVTEFRDSVFNTQIHNSKYLGTGHPRRSVVPTTVRRGVRRMQPVFPKTKIFNQTTKQVVTILEAFSFSGREFWGLTYNVLDSLKQTFMNFSQTASKVSGPVAIIAVGAEVAKSNVDGLYQFAAVLNINLAVINLLPLPALDGGTLALILVEAARGGKKLPLEVEQGIMSSGIMFVIIVGLFLLVRDTLNLDFIRDLL